MCDKFKTFLIFLSIPCCFGQDINPLVSFLYCQNEFDIIPNNCDQFKFPVVSQAICSPKIPPNPLNFSSTYSPPSDKKKMMLTLTNVFEHASKIINYAFCENIGDGRGYTCGSVGFATGTSNALTVIEEYKARGGRSELFKYIPELQRLATSNDCSVPRGDISKLKGFPEIWQKDSCQILFRIVQDEMADYLFFLPSMKLATEMGIKTNLGKAIFYDTAVQHGWQFDDGTSLLSIINLTGPLAGQNEILWLEKFLTIRRKLLCCYPNNVWPASADRVSDLMDLLKAGNLNLTAPLTLSAYKSVITGEEDTENLCSASALPPVSSALTVAPSLVLNGVLSILYLLR